MVPQLREDVLKLAWRAWQDLNLRLSAPEADVLSTELQAQIVIVKEKQRI